AGPLAAPVAAPALRHLSSCIVAAIGTLRRPLHGGANETAIKALLGIESPERAGEFVHDTLAARNKVWGFGHRVYKTWDPRAIILRDVAKELSGRTGNEKLFAVAR